MDGRRPSLPGRRASPPTDATRSCTILPVDLSKLRRLDLNLLVALEALLEERAVTRAGRRIHLSQPAMSSALARLREIFEDPLLEREGNRYRLTPLARRIAGPLEEILTSVEGTLKLREGFDPLSTNQRFLITTADDVMYLLASPILQRLSARAPTARLHLARADARMGRQLSSQRVDLVIAPLGALEGFPSEILLEDRWVCAVWSGHPDVEETLSREQLIAMPHASFALGRDGHSVAHRLLGDYTDKLDVRLSSESALVLPELLRDTRMLAILPRRVGLALQERAALRLLELPVSTPDINLVMWWNAAKAAEPAQVWLREQVAEAARAIG